MDAVDRATGVLWGLACGDALGRPVEFKTTAGIERRHGELREMVGNGTWNKPAGTITDDTDLALCIARSLATEGRFDPADVAEQFVEWYRGGPFDIGGMTADAIKRLERGDDWSTAGQDAWETKPEGSNAGNGSVMRAPPLAVAFADDPGALVRVSRDSSRITHADPRCTWGCAALNLAVAGYLADVDRPLERAVDRIRGDAPDELVAALDAVVDGRPGELQTSGYVVHTLQTALHDARAADSLEEAVVTAVNRGGDTDTVGAVAGAVAGARFGRDGVPERWIEHVEEAAELEALARDLVAIREGSPEAP